MPKITKRQIIDISQDQGYPSKNRRFKRSTDRVVTSSNRRSSVEVSKYHWKPDKPDSRDYTFDDTVTVIPDYVDLRPYCTLIEDQGRLGSCTGQAIAGAVEYLNRRSNKTIDVSRLFIYYFERLYLGTVNYDSGAYIRDGIKVMYNYGAPVEQLWPYNISRFRTRPSNNAVKDAAYRKATRYERVMDHSGCITALAEGYPVVIGFMVYSSFESSIVKTTGMMPYPNTSTESLLGGHAVLLVGYDHSTQRYIARNSWGSNWGDKGYFYMPYQVIQNTAMSSDFWVIKSVNMK